MQLDKSAKRPDPDAILVAIADYARGFMIQSALAYDTARDCLMDTLACGFQALKYPACRKLLGPVVPGASMPGGARVPGTSYELDPVQAAFSIGTMIRWLDFNDTWLAAEWGHPSDNLGGILAVADYIARQARMHGKPPPTVRDVLTAMVKAHEIQGVLALENSFNRVGLDHVILVRVASTAVVTALLGGTAEQVIAAISNAWVDGGSLRTYRHAPNTGSRKSWAAGDATSRAVRLALIALTGEMGYPSALSAPTWGFYDVLFKGKPFSLPQPFGSYVMENVLFKISYPAEFHAQTAVECAMQLHALVAPRLGEVERIVIETQEPGVRIIDKTGPLANPADRDHCIQYMVAVPLIFGRLTAARLRGRGGRGSARRCIARDSCRSARTPSSRRSTTRPTSAISAMRCRYSSATAHRRRASQVDVPIGHRRRRAEGRPLLIKKFEASVAEHFPPKQAALIQGLFANPQKLDAMSVNEFISALVTS